MAGGAQNFEAAAAVPTGFCVGNFCPLLVGWDEAIAQASCTFN